MSAIHRPERPRIGVIVGTDVIGDGLLKLPFVRALRAAWPSARIEWITSRGASVYAGLLGPLVAGLIDEVIECPPWLPTRVSPRVDVTAAPRYGVLFDTSGA